MTIAAESFAVLLEMQGTIARAIVVNQLPVGSDGASGMNCIWLEDSVDAKFQTDTERTVRTGTLQFLDSSCTFSESDKFSIDGEEWQQVHKSGFDAGIRVCHLRRDDKVRTGRPNPRDF